LLTLKARQSAPPRSLPGGSSLTTSAPRSPSTRPAIQPSRSVASMIKTSERSMVLRFQHQPSRCRHGNKRAYPLGQRFRHPHSAPGTGERVDPAHHARARVLDILLAEEVLRLDPIHRIDRAQKIALVAERHCGIDAHAALEIGVRGGPLLLARGHAL